MDFNHGDTEGQRHGNKVLLLEGLTEKIINAAIEVHKSLGPGFLESIYENAFCRELNQRGIKFVRQQEIEIK